MCTSQRQGSQWDFRPSVAVAWTGFPNARIVYAFSDHPTARQAEAWTPNPRRMRTSQRQGSQWDFRPSVAVAWTGFPNARIVYAFSDHPTARQAEAWTPNPEKSAMHTGCVLLPSRELGKFFPIFPFIPSFWHFSESVPSNHSARRVFSPYARSDCPGPAVRGRALFQQPPDKSGRGQPQDAARRPRPLDVRQVVECAQSGAGGPWFMPPSTVNAFEAYCLLGCVTLGSRKRGRQSR